MIGILENFWKKGVRFYFFGIINLFTLENAQEKANFSEKEKPDSKQKI